jgi:NifU-like protein involved in Fe-S cluster formation
VEYSKAVLSRFRHPHHAGRPDLPADKLVSGRAGKRRTGSDVVFYLQIIANEIRDARFEAYGCPHTIAVADYMAGQLIGRPADQAMQETPQQVADQLDLPAEKLGQALIVEDAIIAALGEWEKQ